MELEKFLSKEALQSTNCLTYPYPHVVIDNFLNDETIERLSSSARVAPKEKNNSREGLSNGRSIMWGVLNDLDLVRFFYGKEFRSYVSGLWGEEAVISKGSLPQLTEFVGDERGFDVHNDEYELFDLVFLLYIEGPVEGKGGAFCIHDKNENNKIVKKIYPIRNRCLMFKVSEKSYHSVEGIDAQSLRLNLTLDWEFPQSHRAISRRSLILNKNF
jgi:hypothetical protein